MNYELESDNEKLYQQLEKSGSVFMERNRYGVDCLRYPAFANRCQDMDRKYAQFNSEAIPRLKVLREGMQWMAEKLSSMSLQKRDVIVIIGNSRVGKTTLLTALKGLNMRFMAKDQLLGFKEF